MRMLLSERIEFEPELSILIELLLIVYLLILIELLLIVY